MTTPAYPATTLAKLFDLSERRIQQLAKDGIIPAGVKGKYDLVGSVRGYVKYLQDRALGRSDGAYADPSDIKVERKRLIKAQADNAECAHQLKRGALVRLSAVIEVLNAAAMVYGASIDALPGRLAQELVGMSDPAQIKNVLCDECRTIRNLTADALCRWAEDYASAPGVGEVGPSATLQNPGCVG